MTSQNERGYHLPRGPYSSSKYFPEGRSEQQGSLSATFLNRIMMKWSEVAQSCPTLCNLMDCSLPGSSVHGIFQAKELEWVAISFFRGSSWCRDQTQVSCIAGRCFTVWATREAPKGEQQIIQFYCSHRWLNIVGIVFTNKKLTNYRKCLTWPLSVQLTSWVMNCVPSFD